ncbi:hypothetical protein EIN_060110 [Entamoeba invadens IP1]|uniref:hypothetical protein n=1 Tax=Entamoeba invadens IP1 TaxID=370355 RepID=UPI0002C3DAEC|nr:hypothetical protein EIN_060110 [Entamoeba invadens IP1]ELP93496.1 hypothetical protein EIN_060110 [Entamoeba invadens IP1]|eukprot:XP_004260267.1 hypothetical protein EIN_060110 [Entamoeba invadens IP1]
MISSNLPQPAVQPNPMDANSDKFDPVYFINKNIPQFDHRKISDLEDGTTHEQIQIQKTVFSLLQSQQTLERESLKSMQILPDEVSSLGRKMNTLNGETQYTEAILKSICEGVQLLGLMKSNITFTVQLIRHVEQLDMLISNCQNSLKDNDPLSAADALRTAKLILQTYNEVSSLDIFANSIKELKRVCNEVVSAATTAVVQFEKDDIDKKMMRNYFELVEEVFDEQKDGFKTYLVTHLTMGYANAFPLNAEQSSLLNISKRYQWYLEKLTFAKDKFTNTLPPQWRFWESMTQDFCATSKEAFHDLLEKQSQGNAEQFTTCLVKAIRSTRAFEAEVIKRIRQEKCVEGETCLIYEGIISKCFDGYMDFYIEKEKENVMTFLNKFTNEEKFTVDEGSVVLLSSKDLILYYRKCSERCSALTHGEPLISVCQVIANATCEFSKSMQQKAVCKDLKETLRRQSLVVNTLKYVYFRVERLMTTTLSHLIDQAHDILRVMQTKIIGVIGEITEQIVTVILRPVDDIMMEMTRQNWVMQNDEEIEYVENMTRVIQDYVTVIDKYIVNDYFLQVCSLITAVFCEKYVDMLMKCKRINEIGARNLLIDYSQGRGFFLKLPTRNNPIVLEGIGDTSVKNTNYDLSEYTSETGKEYTKTEAILKILQIGEKDKAYETFQYFFPEMSNDNFQRIWDLKEKQGIQGKTEATLSKIKLTFSKKPDWYRSFFSTMQ